MLLGSPAHSYLMNMLLSRRSFQLGLTACATSLTLAPPALATTVLGLSLDEMVKRSQRVTVGVPVHYSSEWAFVGGTRRIVTFTRVVQEEDLFSDERSADELLVMTLGGTVGDLRQKVPGEAALPLGERALLFATPEYEDGVRLVVGMAQGKYALEADDDRAILRPSRALPHLIRRKQRDGTDETIAVEALSGKSLGETRRLVRGMK